MNRKPHNDVIDSIGSGASQVRYVSSMEQEPSIENNCFAGGGSKTLFVLHRETDLITSRAGHGRQGENERQSAESLDSSQVNETTLTYNQAKRCAGSLSFIENFNYDDGAEYHENRDNALQGNLHQSEDSNYRSFIQTHDNCTGDCRKMDRQNENKSKDFCFKRPRHLQYPWRQVRRRRKLRFLCMAVFYVISISCASLYRRVATNTADQSDEVTREKPRGSLGHREIREASVASNVTKCPEHNRGVMPSDFLSEEVAKKGGWLLHLFIGSYMFAAVASVCDSYFVPSLEHISEDLDLQADVAGATFMAAASSAPEFCTSVITTLVAKSDAGLGAIVGSSIFNLLVIVGACAIFAGMPVQLTWYPLTRDTIFYTLSVILMAVFMYDNIILWYEATLMIVTYLLYILVMFFNKRLERWCILQLKSCRRPTIVDIMEEEESANNRLAMMDARRHSRICTQDTLTRSGMREIERLTLANIWDPKEILAKASRVTISETLVRNISSVYNKVESMDGPVASPVNVETGTSIDPVPAVSSEVQIASPVEEEVEKDEKIGVSEYTNPLEFPKGFLSRCYYIFILPATVLHAFTIPDSRLLGTWQAKLYLVSFTLSVVYIGAYSYVMVWMITMAGNVWGIPDTITGLTVLAAGTSVPDLLASVFVARDGYGDMAVSNAIGSNVFDILLCLGIPWLIDNLSISKNGTVIDSEGMVFAVLTLFITIAYLWGSMKCFNWTLTPVYGVVTISVYLVIMTFCILIETNVLFGFHEPSPCK